MKNSAAAARYARAVFELGLELGQLEKLTSELTALSEIYQTSAELRGAVQNPVLPPSVREKLVREVARRAKLSQMATRTLLVLLRRQRMGILPELVRELVRLTDEKNGVCRAKITSANSLSQSFLQRIKISLEKSTGKRVELEHQEDASLIGGLITQVGDNLFDGSLEGRLRQLEKSLLGSA